jgi:nucleotide-binding universal stress UspA family protein
VTKTPQVIAVGFDGSAPSELAVTWAMDFARRIDADVVLVHAVGILEHMAHEAVTEQFAGTVHALATKTGFDESRLRWHVDNGDACSVMLRAGQEPLAATLLVVGSRGHGAHAGHMLGSTSLQLAERSTLPLVIIPAGAVLTS